MANEQESLCACFHRLVDHDSLGCRIEGCLCLNGAPDESDRLAEMLAELEHQAVCARRHEEKMRAALTESAGWSHAEDRAWIVEAAAEADQMAKDAFERLRRGRAIVGRVRSGNA